MLEPIFEERPMGRIEVRQVFFISKLGTIAGILGSAARSHEVLYSSRILKKTGLRLA